MYNTKEEVEADLLIVNNAISRMIQGKFTEEFYIGSAELTRRYKFTTMTLDELKRHRQELLDLLAVFSPVEVAPVIRANSSIRLLNQKLR